MLKAIPKQAQTSSKENVPISTQVPLLLAVVKQPLIWIRTNDTAF